MKKVRDYLRLMRIRHYIKNLIVFAAPMCSGQLFRPDKLEAASAGFIAFCAVSSAVYIVNDIQDREKDCLHPEKKKRPIASGAISPQSAKILAGALLLVTALFCSLTQHFWASFLLVLYFGLNLAYSVGLKDFPLIDVAILSAGFLLRVAYGAMITNVEMSNWLYLVIITFALYFSLGKRRNEIKRIHSNGKTRKVLRYYSIDFLDKSMYMCLTLSNTFYALWCMDDGTLFRYGVNLLFTVPVVLFITMRYSMDVEGDSEGDPVEVLPHDRLLLVLCGVYLMIMFYMLYCLL